MEQGQLNSMFPANPRDALLRLIQSPVGCQITAVFITIRVSNHHRLLIAQPPQVLAINWQVEQVIQYRGCTSEICDGLEEGRNLQIFGATCPMRQQQYR
jgi:hypothetical protein